MTSLQPFTQSLPRDPYNLPRLTDVQPSQLTITIDPTMSQLPAVPASRSNSFSAQVRELGIGESVSKVRAIDPTTTVQRLPDEMPMLREQVRNACSPAVKRAKEITGGTYTVEVGDVVMPSGNFYVVAVITRTA